jgi:major type 1 subunit fimbrin (pilin)
MKKSNIAKLAAIAFAGVLSQGAFAADGTINFNGKIVDAPCSISPASQNQIVPLGTVNRDYFTGLGVKATPAKFNIELLNCGASATGATVTFTGTADANVTDDLRIGVGEVAGAAATGVAIELGDSAGTKIGLGSESGLYTLALGDNPLKFQAVYVQTLPAVTVGSANAVSQFTVNYK